MKEQLTDSQIAQAKKNLEICQQSLAQQIEQLSEDAQKKAVEQIKIAQQELKNAQQKLAKLPEDLIEQLSTTIEKLMNIINGYERPGSETLNVDVIIKEIEKLLNPVISALNSLPVPSIPGLDHITDLLAKLPSLLNSNSSGKTEADLKKLVPKKPAIPNELMAFLYDLLAAITSLCATLPMVLINLIFKMLDTIIGMFKQIADIIGVPGIPYPLSLVPQCIESVPKITDCVLNLPVKLNVAVQGTIRKKLREIAAMKFPDAPEALKEVEPPKDLPACPARSE